MLLRRFGYTVAILGSGCALGLAVWGPALIWTPAANNPGSFLAVCLVAGIGVALAWAAASDCRQNDQ